MTDAGVRQPRSNVPPPGWERLEIWLPRELKKAAKRVAIDRDTTVSEIVRTALEREIRSE